MSSINEHFTIQYSQPSEYRLSHDSVFLARQVFEKLQNLNLQNAQCLDICSGSGVIGMDFLFHRREANQTLPKLFDFLEIQEIYKSHFEENIKRLGPIETKLNFEWRNYNDLQKSEFQEKYDLILCCPPYFLPNQGKMSQSEFKNRCRFFIDSDIKNLLLGISFSLKKTGFAFILLRDLPEHKIDMINEARMICKERLRLEVLGDIRGTHFVELKPI